MMDLIRDIVIDNTNTIYDFYFNFDKELTIMNIHQLFLNVVNLNHNRFFNENELNLAYDMIYDHFMKTIILTHKEPECLQLILEIIENIFEEIILLAEDYNQFEMCKNILQLKNMLIFDTVKK